MNPKVHSSQQSLEIVLTRESNWSSSQPGVTPVSDDSDFFSGGSDPRLNSEDPLFPSMSGEATHTTVLLLIFSISLIANLVVVVLFYLKPSMRSFSNRFVVHLSVIHILHAGLVTPYIVASSLSGNWIFGQAWCQISGLASLSLNMATVLSLLLIAVDRNCAVNSPLHYTMTITKKRTGGLIVSVWVLSLLSSLPPLFGVSSIDYRPLWGLCTVAWVPGDVCSIVYSIYLCLVGFLMPFFKMTWIYVSMFRAARNNSARARQHSFNSTNTDSDVPDVQTPCGVPIGFPKRTSRTSCNPTRRRSSCGSQSFIFGEEWRAAKTGAIILSSFFVCWFPFFATALSEPWIPEPYHVPSFVPPLVILLSLSASIVNPYIYVFRNRTARKHIKKLFNCLRRGRRRTRGTGLSASQNLRGYQGPFPRCPAPGAMTSSFRDRTVIWRSMTISQDGTVSTVSDLTQPLALVNGQIRQNKLAALDAAAENMLTVDDTTTLDGSLVVKMTSNGQPEQEILSLKSTDGLLLLKMHRIHRDSTLSDSTTTNWNSSCESNATSEEVRVEPTKAHHVETVKLPRSEWLVSTRGNSFYKAKIKPPLKRSQTTIEEQEMAMLAIAAQAQIRDGTFKINRGFKTRLNSDESSEATSSICSGEVQEVTPTAMLLAPTLVLGNSSRTKLRPRLVRQCTAIIHYPETEEEEKDVKELSRWHEC